MFKFKQVYLITFILSFTAAEAPDDIYPQCFMSPTGDLREGDNITLSCLSRGGEPQPELYWLQNNADFNREMEQFQSYTRNDVTVVLTNDLIGSVFECQATHPAYSSTKVCTLDPLIFECKLIEKRKKKKR